MRQRNLGVVFAGNVSKAMRTAGTHKQGLVKAMHMTELAQKTAISRSTLNAYIVQARAGSDPNPSLGTIRKIAEALKVPPYFLIMAPQDWSDLAQAINFFARFHRIQRPSRKFEPLNRNLTTGEQAQFGFDIAKSLDLFLEESSANVSQDKNPQTLGSVCGVCATSALIPLQELAADDRIAALLISVIIGARTPS